MSLKHITRLDYGKAIGWWVRIRRKSNPCSKLFSDNIYGGKDEALEAAIVWRDEQLVNAPKLNLRTAESRSKKIKTGVPGLSVSIADGARGKLIHLQVSVSRFGKRTNHRYSVSKWGLRAALWKSCVLMARGSLQYENRILQALALEYFEAAYPNVASVLVSAGCVDEVSNQDK